MSSLEANPEGVSKKAKFSDSLQKCFPRMVPLYDGLFFAEPYLLGANCALIAENTGILSNRALHLRKPRRGKDKDKAIPFFWAFKKVFCGFLRLAVSEILKKAEKIDQKLTQTFRQISKEWVKIEFSWFLCKKITSKKSHFPFKMHEENFYENFA